MPTEDPFEVFQGHPNHSSPHPRDYVSRSPNQHQGATIGDGIRSSAKIAAAMTVVTLLFKSGPVLLVGLGGLILCARSCMPLGQPVAPKTATVSFEQPTRLMQSQSTITSSPYVAPVRPGPMIQPRTSRVASRGQTVVEELDQTPMVIVEDEQPQFVTEPVGFRAPTFEFENSFFGVRPGIRLDPNLSSPFMGMGQFPGGGLFGPVIAPTNRPLSDASRMFMENTISGGSDLTMPPEQFSFKRGRKFIGTSQMPGQPSMRVQLTIVSVKDQGTNVTARLSSLEGKKFSRNYNGLIETDPLRLTLIPEAQSNGFGTFMTYSPWHSNSPTKISLTINTDKGLSGTSYSSELFELTAETESPSSPTAARSGFQGFDTDEQSATEWTVKFKNGKTVFGEAWEFSGESQSFVWKREGKVIAKGNYAEGLAGRTLDLIIVSPTSTKSFECLFFVTPADLRSIRVCVPKSPEEKRPIGLDSSIGNLFDLECVLGGRPR